MNLCKVIAGVLTLSATVQSKPLLAEKSLAPFPAPNRGLGKSYGKQSILLALDSVTPAESNKKSLAGHYETLSAQLAPQIYSNYNKYLTQGLLGILVSIDKPKSPSYNCGAPPKGVCSVLSAVRSAPLFQIAPDVVQGPRITVFMPKKL